jgi:hypothetical protein
VCDDRISLADCAKAMGKGQKWLCKALQEDSLRSPLEKKYPFADAEKPDKQWCYIIYKARFEAWKSGGGAIHFDAEKFAETVAALVSKRIVKDLAAAIVKTNSN